VRNIATLNAQTGPVLTAYRADTAIAALLAAAAREAPLFSVAGPNDVQHSVWRIAAPATVAELGAALNAQRALYIADGHHRSAAAARVAATRRGNADASHEFFLCVAFADDELRILDYNRVVRDLGGLSGEAFLGRVRESFAVRERPSGATPARTETFAMYLGGRWYELAIEPKLVPRHDPVASLDVSLLQDRLLGPILGIGDPRTDPRVDFVGGIRGFKELEQRVQSGAAAVAFALHPTSMAQLMGVADAGLLMPPKSTWFEPKLADGLLTHVLD
jgi:uncharacterized protein (DUF1015 family)